MLYFILLLFSALAKTNSLGIGILYSGAGPFLPYGRTVPVIANYWLSHRNLSSVQLRFCDVKSNASLVGPCVKTLVSYNVSFLVAPETYLTSFAMQTLSSIDRLDIPVIAGMAATPDVFIKNGVRAYPNLFGVMSPSFYYFRALIPYLYVYGLTRVAIISSLGQPDNSVCLGAVNILKDFQNGKMVLSYFGQFTTDTDFIQHLEAIKDLEVEILIICHRLGCGASVNMLAALNIVPSALALFECANFVSSLRSEVLEKIKFIYTPLQWDYRLQGGDFTDPPWALFPNNSAFSFDRAISSLVPYPLSSLAPSQMAAFYVIEDAMRRCPSCSSPMQYLSYVASTYLRTFYGLIRFDDVGMNDGREMVVVQLDHDYVPQIISPLSSATSRPVIPMPSWKERIYTPNPFEYPVEKVYYALLALFSSLLIGTFLTLYKYRLHAKLKALSLHFLSLSMIGMWLWAFAPLTWKIEEESELICQARILFWSIPPILYIIPFAVKTVRIYIIFSSKVFTVKKLTDLKLGKWTMFSVSPFLLISIIGASIIKSSIIVKDPNRPLSNRLICELPSAFTYFYLSLFMVLIVTSSGLAYQIRHTSREYNDAKAMGYLFYNLTFISVISLACHLSLDSEILLYGIRTLALIFHLISALLIYIERIVSSEPEVDGHSSIPQSEAKVKPSIVVELDQPRKSQRYESPTSINTP